MILRVVFGLILIGMPSSFADASVISFVTGLFNNNPVIEEKIDINSQNMALLQTTLKSDGGVSKGGGNIIIVENTALLSEVGPSGSMADIKEISVSDQISVYVVKEGDSLSQIAKMFSVSVNTIVWANDLHNNIIKKGQSLIILPVSGVRHEIIKGETLASISKKYKGDLDEIVQFNDLKVDSKLAIGDIVIVPEGDMGSYNYDIKTEKSVINNNPYRGGSGPYYGGFYIKPVNGIKTQGLHGYNAIDFGASVGEPIIASASGQVIISREYGWNGGYGNYIVIKHNNGTQTLYAHNSKNIVYVGQNVVQGQVIGYVGSTGNSTGPHVHFEIRGAQNPF
ncbi:peptidoglycan DD-metalloendopeptidase family protein [Candidatus Parcubacteria bacterium]|nr:peptidoglycan DD-metalloendopeptidase family protein [Candidatus Parcubacteria bacterium]